MGGSQIGAKVEELERRLLSGKDFTEAAHYFHEHLIRDRAFVDAGEARDNAALLAALNTVVAMVFGGSELRDVHLVHVASFELWHGLGCWGAHGTLLVVYLQRADLGLLSIAQSIRDPFAHFIRFSVGGRSEARSEE